MRLLIITREFPGYVLGGISYHLANLYSEVVAQDHELTVITGKCPQSNRELIDEAPAVEELHTVEFGHRKGYQLLFPLALGNFLRSYDTKQFDACMAHTEMPFDLDLPVITVKHDCFRAVRSFVRGRLRPHERAVDSLIDPIRRYIDRRSMAVSDQLVFNSRLCRDAWNDHYDFDTPSRVVHNGVDTNVFYPRDQPPQIAGEYVLFVGNSERKGLSRVIDFAERSEEEVVMVGPPAVDTDGAKALGRVSQNELARLYTGAVATIHPTHFEAFGNVVLESVACGTPVVTTEMCGAAEILDDSCSVITEDLTTGVERARTLDPQDCVKKARGRTWADIAEQSLSMIKDVVEDPVRNRT